MLIDDPKFYKNEDLSYIAALVDVSGKFVLNKHNSVKLAYPKYDFYLEISSPDNLPLYKVSETFVGGQIKAVTMKRSSEIKHWILIIKDYEAFNLLKHIKPYLTAKQLLVTLVEEFYNYKENFKPNKKIFMRDKLIFEKYEEFRLLFNLLSHDPNLKKDPEFLRAIHNRKNEKFNSHNKLNLKINEQFS